MSHRACSSTYYDDGSRGQLSRRAKEVAGAREKPDHSTKMVKRELAIFLAVAAAALGVACSKTPALPERPPVPAGLSIVASESGTFTRSQSGRYVLEVENPGISISSVSITSQSDEPSVRVRVDALEGSSSAFEPPGAADVYQILEITRDAPEPGSVSDVTLRFRVPRGWIESHGHHQDDITLERLVTEWQPLPTDVIGAVGEDVLFQARSPGLSIFAVTVQRRLAREITPPIPTASPIAPTPGPDQSPLRPPGVNVHPTPTVEPAPTESPPPLPRDASPTPTSSPRATAVVSRASATPMSIPTPTASPTSLPTSTPVPTPSSIPTSSPVPTATDTPVPTPSPTLTPGPTATPVPPTATPLPPIATPVPPTATPVPSTATPVT